MVGILSWLGPATEAVDRATEADKRTAEYQACSRWPHPTHLPDLGDQIFEERGGAEAEEIRAHPIGAESIAQHKQVPGGLLRFPDAPGDLYPHLPADVPAQVPDRLHDAQRGRERGAGAGLTRRGLDEVGSSGHDQDAGPADVVVGTELPGLQDDLQSSDPAEFLGSGDLFEGLAELPRQERR